MIWRRPEYRLPFFLLILTLLLALLGVAVGLLITERPLPNPVEFIGKRLEDVRGSESGQRPAVKTIAQQSGEGEIPYSTLTTLLAGDKISALTLTPEGQAKIAFKDKSQGQSSFPPESLAAVADRGSKAGAKVEIKDQLSPGGWLARLWGHTLARTVIILALILFSFTVAYWLTDRRRRQKFPAGQSASQRRRSGTRATSESGSRPKVGFGDVAGCPEAVTEISEFLDFLRHPDNFQLVGAKMPSGAVLHGPPGTGKTLLARALAGEAEVPFLDFSGSEAVNKYVGVGADNLRKLFKRARQSETGAVIFIDEIDALGRKRSGGADGANREYDQTLNQLLTELDGFNSTERVVVIAATNRLDVLDPALLRPGRLSRHIPVLPPSEAGRQEILALYTADKPLADDVDLAGLARITAGSTGADLADMVNEAAIQAAREHRSTITEADLREGHLRALAGPQRRSATLRPEERQQVAVHEAGHVLAAELLPDHEKAQRVTIIARGAAAGLAVYGREDRALHSPEYVQQQLIAILGGRAAERVVFGTVSSGAANDLQQANELARRAIEEWGLSELTGQLVSRGSGGDISEQTKALVDQEVEDMVAEGFAHSVQLLTENRRALEQLATALQEQETMERADILAAIGRRPATRPLASSSRRHPQLQAVMGPTQPDHQPERAVKPLPRPRLAAWLTGVRNWRRQRKKVNS